jgi:hypothetical protein
VNGKTRPSPFFVEPASSLTSPAPMSTCRHSSVRISDGVRQPVTYANSANRAHGHGEMRNHLVKLGRLEKATPNVLLFKQRDVRAVHLQLVRLRPPPKSPVFSHFRSQEAYRNKRGLEWEETDEFDGNKRSAHPWSLRQGGAHGSAEVEELFADESAHPTSGTYTLSLSTTSKPVGGLDTSMANNLGVDSQTSSAVRWRRILPWAR